jgi:hypothetical protein
MFYRFMNDGNIKWRKLLYAMNLQLTRKISRCTEAGHDKPVCLIIDDTDAPKSGRADSQTQCIFVDMAEIWESFLRKKLGEGFADDGWRVLSVEECHYSIYQGQFFAREIIPDIILTRQKENGEKEYMVFDAKYKRMSGVKEDVDRTDIFQIHTYIQYVQHYMGKVVIGGLLYPITSKGKDDGITEENNNSSLYFSNYLFGCEGKYDTPFIIDGILFPELKEDERTVTEVMMDKNAELMNKKVEAMIKRIKKAANL